MTERSVIGNASAERVELVEDRRGPLLRAVSPRLTGSPDRAERNADAIESTLHAVEAAAETAGR
jgi:hypothetical protein